MDPHEFEYRMERAYRKAMGLPVGKDRYSLSCTGVILCALVPVVVFMVFAYVVFASALFSGEIPVGGKPVESEGLERVEDDRRGIVISLPKVRDGWERGANSGDGVYVTTGSYECGSATCVSGSIMTDDTTGFDDVKSAARGVIKARADKAYSEVRKYTRLKAGPVSLAGSDAYLVRWKVDAAQGPDGYVQVVAFPMVGKRIGLLHIVLDDSSEAPGLAVMDQVVAGVAPA